MNKGNKENGKKEKKLKKMKRWSDVRFNNFSNSEIRTNINFVLGMVGLIAAGARSNSEEHDVIESEK